MEYKRRYTLSDDVMFGRVMEDNDLCRRFLSVLFQRDVGELFSVEREKYLHETIDGKPIRLDILAKNEHSAIYDGEMQKLNNKSIESLYLPKRTRYYQGMIDMNLIKAGCKYKNLPESNVIFICMFDPFGENRPVYTFTDICEESRNLELNTTCKKIFINVMSTEPVPDDMRELFDYLKSGKISGGFIEELDSVVYAIETNEGWRLDKMKELLIAQDRYDDGFADGEIIGRDEGIDYALNELSSLLATGLSAEEAIQKLKETRQK